MCKIISQQHHAESFLIKTSVNQRSQNRGLKSDVVINHVKVPAGFCILLTANQQGVPGYPGSLIFSVDMKKNWVDLAI